MAILNNVLDDFINKLREDAHFKDIKIIKAYPYVVKPTRLSKPVLCAGLGDVKGEASGIGEQSIYGKYAIDIDIFVPYKIGANVIPQILNDIVNNCKSNLPLSVSSSGIENDSAALCYKARCSLTFNDLLDTGGAHIG